MNVKKIEYFKVDYNDLDKSINEFLKSKELEDNFEIVAHHELKNDISVTFTVARKMPDDYSLNEIKRGDYHWCAGEILDWMCFENLIEPGQYLVNISW